jgi:hypothetical protein
VQPHRPRRKVPGISFAGLGSALPEAPSLGLLFLAYLSVTARWSAAQAVRSTTRLIAGITAPTETITTVAITVIAAAKGTDRYLAGDHSLARVVFLPVCSDQSGVHLSHFELNRICVR